MIATTNAATINLFRIVGLNLTFRATYTYLAAGFIPTLACGYANAADLRVGDVLLNDDGNPCGTIERILTTDVNHATLITRCRGSLNYLQVNYDEDYFDFAREVS